ncbi:hypothetical protein LEMLEM_LOCUS19804 [Lemmus lemmus]
MSVIADSALTTFQDSQSLAWCLVVDLCIWFYQLLNEGSMICLEKKARGILQDVNSGFHGGSLRILPSNKAM